MMKQLKKSFNPRWIMLFLVAYVFTAYSWWTILHFKNNKAYFNSNFEIIKLRNPSLPLYEIEKTQAFKQLSATYSNKNLMIIGEAFVFISILLFGTNWIYKRQKKEADFNLQQQNFLHSVTHELKSPLSGIKLGVETILCRKLEGDNKEKLLNMSLDEVNRLNALIDNLLLSAKLDGTMLNTDKKNYTIDALLLPIISKLRLVNTNRIIELNIDEKQAILTTDKMMFESIVINLVENAIKYSPKSEKIMIDCFNKNNKVSIMVSDFGNGISDKDKKLIFTKFYRVGNEMTRTTKGTGLGLFIVSQLVKALNGKITIEDNIPKGSKFIVELYIT